MTCLVEGCGREVSIRSAGLCSRCYQRAWRQRHPGQAGVYVKKWLETHPEWKPKPSTRVRTEEQIAKERARDRERYYRDHSPKPKLTDMERFMSRVVVSESGCWLWQGYLQDGYGRFVVGKKPYLAHRWIFAETSGVSLDQDNHIHHECGVSRCVQPDHLTQVTEDEHKALHPTKRYRVKCCDHICAEEEGRNQAMESHSVSHSQP